MTDRLAHVMSQVQTTIIKDQVGFPKLEENQMVEGILVSKNQETSLVQLLGSKIQIQDKLEVVEEVGDSISFKVVSQDTKQLILKYIPTKDFTTENTNPVPASLSRISQTINQLEHQIQKMTRHLSGSEKEVITQMRLNAMTSIESLLTDMTAIDYQGLVAEGFDPQKLSLDVMASLIRENKALVRHHDLEGLSAKIPEAIAKRLAHLSDGPTLEKVTLALREANMPVTEKNIEKVMGQVSKVEALLDLDQEKILKLLTIKGDLSIKNIDQSLRVANLQKTPLLDEAILKPLIENRLVAMKIPVTQDHLGAAIRLVEADLEITPEKIIALTNPTSITARVNLELIVKELVSQLKAHMPLEQVQIEPLRVLFEERPNTEAVLEKPRLDAVIDMKQVDKTMASFLELGEDTILMRSRASQSLTIVDLVEGEPIKEGQRVDRSMDFDTMNQALKVINDRIIIEEIRLKWTISAGYRLRDQGINITTIPIEEALSRLKEDGERVKAAYEKMTLDLSGLRVESTSVGSVTSSSENVTEIRNVYNLMTSKHIQEAMVVQLIQNPEMPIETLANRASTHRLTAFAKSFEQAYGMSLSQIIEEVPQVSLAPRGHEIPTQQEPDLSQGVNQAPSKPDDLRTLDWDLEKNVSTRLVQASYAYSQGETQVRRDLGDSIEATFDHIPALLESLGLESTEVQIQSAKILARSQLAVTEENLLRVAVLSEKLTYLNQKMTPMMLQKMVQAGIAPTKLSLDEAVMMVASLESTFGSDQEESIPRMIHAMMEEGSLTEVEKDGLIGIYRTLHTVHQSKGAALGFMVKHNLSLNLEDLFEAAKYIRKTKGLGASLQVKVDDQFGKLEKIITGEPSIKASVEKALSRTGEPISQDMVKAYEVLIRQGETPTPLKALRLTLYQYQVSAFAQEIERHSGHALKPLLGPDQAKHDLADLTALMRTFEAIKGEDVEQDRAYLAFMKKNPEIIQDMLVKGMPLTLNNFKMIMRELEEPHEALRHLRHLMTHGSNEVKALIREKVEALTQEIRDIGVTKERLATFYKGLEKEAEVLEGLDYKDLNALSSLRHHGLARQVIQDPSISLPYLFNGSPQTLNFYLISDRESRSYKEEGYQILLTLETKNMGQVMSLMTIKGNQLSMNISSTYSEDRALIMTFEEEIRGLISQSHFNLGTCSYEAIQGLNQLQSQEGQEALSQGNNKVSKEGHIDWVV